MIQFHTAVVPITAGAVDAALSLVQVDDADAVDVGAGEAVGRSALTGGTVHVAVLTGEGSIHGVLPVRAGPIADSCILIQVVINVGNNCSVWSATPALVRI